MDVGILHHQISFFFKIRAWLTFGGLYRRTTHHSVRDEWLQQEAQLSERGRTTLRVTEYFVKSLKVIRNDTVE